MIPANPIDTQRLERDAQRIEDLLVNLEAASAPVADGREIYRALTIIAELGSDGIIPKLEPATGRRFADLLTQLLGPLRIAFAGELDPQDLHAGITAASAIARSFGREWEDMRKYVGDELMLDRIGNVLILANAIQSALLRRSSVQRGEPHRRSLIIATRTGDA